MIDRRGGTPPRRAAGEPSLFRAPAGGGSLDRERGVQDVVVVSADALVASALTTILSADQSLRVAMRPCLDGAVDDRPGRPVVLVYDVGPGSRLDVRAMAELGLVAQRARVIVVVPTESSEQIPTLLRTGARGIVGRDAGLEELVQAVSEVSDGHAFASRLMLGRIVDHVARCSRRAHDSRVAADEVLAPRERDIVGLLTRGMTNREIASALHLSEATVKAHLGRVMMKWQVRDRLQVALRALDLADDVR